jgi:hypothetical protein
MPKKRAGKERKKQFRAAQPADRPRRRPDRRTGRWAGWREKAGEAQPAWAVWPTDLETVHLGAVPGESRGTPDGPVKGPAHRGGNRPSIERWRDTFCHDSVRPGG